MFTYAGSPNPPSRFPMKDGASMTSLSALGSVLQTMPASHISATICTTTSYEFSNLVGSKGAPRKSSSASATRWRNSRTRRGSVSADVEARNNRRSWTIEKTRTGGFVLGR